MSGVAAAAATFAAAMCALNAGLYVWAGSPVSLGAAVFCGLLMVVNLAIGTRR